MVAEPAALDFGKVGALGHVSATIELRNLGDTPVTIDEIQTQCRCTTTILKPGDEVIQSG